MNHFVDPGNYSIHPECPDWRRLGDNEQEAALRAWGMAAADDGEARDKAWSKGFSRRRLLEGGLGVGVAAFASQLVTTRVAYAAPGQSVSNSLVVVFLRGGLDGLSVLVPGDDPVLLSSRPDIAIRARTLMQFNGSRGFGLHPALKALQPMLQQGRIAAVPDIATPALTRSHFQAQDCLERGGSDTGSRAGWLDRVLEQLGAGTTFRSMSVTSNLSRSLVGTTSSLVGRSAEDFEIPGGKELSSRTREAIRQLYVGLDHPYTVQTGIALEVSTQTATLKAHAGNYDDGRFPKGSFGSDLRTLSALIRSGVGLRVATVDLGGWDMHTGIGTVDRGDMRDMLESLGNGLAAFFKDLGDKADSTTVVVMSEFGRRAEQNASGGTDHGHGGLAMVLGAGVRGGVHGTWKGLSPTMLAEGDLPGTNDFRDFLGEIVMSRLGLSAGQMGQVFPDWKIAPKGVMR